MGKIEELLQSLSQSERKILPLINEGIERVEEESKLDKTTIMRAIQFLENKELIEKETKKTKIIDLDDNGREYLKNGLPERKLINLLLKKESLNIKETKDSDILSKQEFGVAIGTLKRKGIIKIDGEIIKINNFDEAKKELLAEKLLKELPRSLDSLNKEMIMAYEELLSRSGIIRVKEISKHQIKLTSLGEDVNRCSVDSSYNDMIEQVTPEIINKESWKGRRFRTYDIKSRVPETAGGKRHFVNQAIDYGKKVWAEMGFKEMSGKLTQTGFWNFDALFTAQDHPVREMQDTFYIEGIKGKLPEKKLLEAVRDAHQGRIKGSKGWGGKWNEEETKKVLLRTHTTPLSARTLVAISKLPPEKRAGKFFAIGMNFRNETVDWSHGFQFNQSEGIVVGKGLTFANLLGYLEEFFKKMGYQKVRFRPSYFPYTKPSVEIDVWNKERGVWLELGGAGMFRPEVTIPLLGEHIPVLAWGPGFDRSMMQYYDIKDLRELYSNDLNKLRKKKMWMK